MKALRIWIFKRQMGRCIRQANRHYRRLEREEECRKFWEKIAAEAGNRR